MSQAFCSAAVLFNNLYLVSQASKLRSVKSIWGLLLGRTVKLTRTLRPSLPLISQWSKSVKFGIGFRRQCHLICPRLYKRSNVSEICNKLEEGRWLIYILPKFGIVRSPFEKTGLRFCRLKRTWEMCWIVNNSARFYWNLINWCVSRDRAVVKCTSGKIRDSKLGPNLEF